MRPLIAIRLTMLLALVALAAPAASLAQEGQEVIRDCAQDGDLDGNYSQDELDDAYDNMPSDVDQYSNCRQVIDAARERGAGGSDDGDGGGQDGSGAATGGGGSSDGPKGAPGGRGNDLDELDKRREGSKHGDAPTVGETAESSGGTYATNAASNGGMSTALIVALIAAALAAVAGALYLLRDYLPPAIGQRLPGPLKQDPQV